MRSPYRLYFAVWAAITLILTGAAIILLGTFTQYRINALILLWASANVGTFFLYGWDKSIAGSGRTRVPEKILYLVSFLGGPLGSMLGMNLFRHKTRRPGFGLIVALISLLQVGIILLWLTVNQQS